MDRRTRSIIEELDRFVSDRDKHAIIEARANHVIVSAINLLQMIEESFTADDAERLTKRLFLAMKSQNPKKFENTVRQLREKVR